MQGFGRCEYGQGILDKKTERNGGHDKGRVSSGNQGIDQGFFHHESQKKSGNNDGGDDGGSEGQVEHTVEENHEKGRYGHKFAFGKIDQPGTLPQKTEPDGDHGVDRAERKTFNQQLFYHNCFCGSVEAFRPPRNLLLSL